MKLFVFGLGNPGKEYEKTRHNAGFSVVNNFALKVGTTFKRKPNHPFEEASISLMGSSVTLIKPITYMNESGLAAREVLKNQSDYQALVICDNMDLAPGLIRFRFGGGSAGQKGLKSIIDRCGTAEFLRLYIGMGHPEPGKDVADWVLGTPFGADKDAISSAILRAADAVGDFCSGMTIEELQQKYN